MFCQALYHVIMCANDINYKMYSFRPSFWFVNTAFQQSWNPQHSNIYDVCLPYYVAPIEDTDIIS